MLLIGKKSVAFEPTMVRLRSRVSLFFLRNVSVDYVKTANGVVFISDIHFIPVKLCVNKQK